MHFYQNQDQIIEIHQLSHRQLPLIAVIILYFCKFVLMQMELNIFKVWWGHWVWKLECKFLIKRNKIWMTNQSDYACLKYVIFWHLVRFWQIVIISHSIGWVLTKTQISKPSKSKQSKEISINHKYVGTKEGIAKEGCSPSIQVYDFWSNRFSTNCWKGIKPSGNCKLHSIDL